MTARLDHAVFAWEDLDAITEVFTRLGLAPEYGGQHGDGTTEMAVLGFDDGSYFELIAPTDAEEPPQRWPDELADSAGPCAWCLDVDDLRARLKRLIDAGTEVRGPTPLSRERPDGTLVEWEMGWYGSEAATQRFPFLISDLTPREYRVRPSESVAGSTLTGIGQVVLAVADLDAAVDQFRRLHRYPSPTRSVAEPFGATLASFPGKPAVLAEPLGETRIADRLERYRSCPCAYLVESPDFDATEREYPLTGLTEWFGHRIGWFDAPELDQRVGVIEG